MSAQKPSFSRAASAWATRPKNARFALAPCLAGADNHAISQTCVTTARRPAQFIDYSVYNEFAHGLALAAVWRATQGEVGFIAEFVTVFPYRIRAVKLGYPPFCIFFVPI